MKDKISVNNLTKKFGDLLVLDKISFDINQGEFVCIVGPTGCGKTTFLNLLTRLIKPTEGKLLIDGEPADPKSIISHLLSKNLQQCRWLTVKENLEFGMKIKKLPVSERNARVDRLMKLLGLAQFENNYPYELSVSAEQSVIIGRAFSTYPDLLLMDEPYGQMDIKMRYYLEDQVLRLWKEFNSTIIFITHNVEEAVYLAERVLILSNKPAKIKEDMQIELPRPRSIADPEFIKIRKHITDAIKWW